MCREKFKEYLKSRKVLFSPRRPSISEKFPLSNSSKLFLQSFQVNFQATFFDSAMKVFCRIFFYGLVCREFLKIADH